MSAPAPSGERELVFCHGCEEEWYRDEHGLVCPNCHSDFVEIIEADHDPREPDFDEDFLLPFPGATGELRSPSHNPFGAHDRLAPGGAPDPDEGDVNNLRWESTGPNSYSVRGTLASPFPANRGQSPDLPQPDRSGLLGPIMGLLNNVTGGHFAGGNSEQNQQQHPSHSPPPIPPRTTRMTTITTPGGGTRITYSTSASFSLGGGGRSPGPDHPVNDLSDLIGHMLANAPPPQARGPGGQTINQAPPLHALLSVLFGASPDGVLGDAVYSQEAFDRIVSQFMEQNQTGNAPGPAPEDAINTLPKRKVDAEMLGESGKAECSICMDDVTLGEEVTEMWCRHWFHTACVTAWLNEHDTCPHCRMGVEEARDKAQEKGKTTPKTAEPQAESSRSQPPTSPGPDTNVSSFAEDFYNSYAPPVPPSTSRPRQNDRRSESPPPLDWDLHPRNSSR